MDLPSFLQPDTAKSAKIADLLAREQALRNEPNLELLFRRLRIAFPDVFAEDDFYWFAFNHPYF